MPFDVLLVIASFCSRPTLLRIMSTNRDLYRGCPKYILADPVRLGGDRRVVSFIRFMRPHRRNRWRHLLSLTMTGPALSPEVAEELAKEIHHASRLRDLHFTDAEDTLGSHPNLAIEFALLKSVKRVKIFKGFRHACRMLEAMHWPLEEISLADMAVRYDVDYWLEPGWLQRMHPTVLLKNAQSTLKQFTQDGWREYYESPSPYIYPNLRSLVIRDVWHPRSVLWTSAFPQLQSLTVYTIDSDLIGDDPDDSDVYAHFQESNREEQLRSGNAWKRLETFKGNSILDLYILGLPCRIEHVDVGVGAGCLRYFRTVMADARPMHLTLFFFGCIALPLDWPAYLQDPSLRDLHTLDIDITFVIQGKHEGSMEACLVSDCPT